MKKRYLGGLLLQYKKVLSFCLYSVSFFFLLYLFLTVVPKPANAQCAGTPCGSGYSWVWRTQNLDGYCCRNGADNTCRNQGINNACVGVPYTCTGGSWQVTNINGECTASCTACIGSGTGCQPPLNAQFLTPAVPATCANCVTSRANLANFFIGAGFTGCTNVEMASYWCNGGVSSQGISDCSYIRSTPNANNGCQNECGGSNCIADGGGPCTSGPQCCSGSCNITNQVCNTGNNLPTATIGIPPSGGPTLTLPPPITGFTQVDVRAPGNIAATPTNISPSRVVQFIFNLLVAVGIVAALAYLLYGGVRWITSAGDKAAVESARNHIVAAVVGLLILVLSWGSRQPGYDNSWTSRFTNSTYHTHLNIILITNFFFIIYNRYRHYCYCVNEKIRNC